VNKRIFAAVFMLTLTAAALYAGGKKEGVFYVAEKGKDTRTGLSKSQAFKTLQKATEAAAEGAMKKIIVVGDLTGPQIIGASADAELLVRGDGKGAVIRGTKGETAVLRVTGTSRVRLENLEITGGHGLSGGGILVENSASVTLGPWTMVRGNEADMGGGVYFLSSGTFTLDGGTVTENRAKRGGGIFFTAVPAAENNTSAFLMKNGYVTQNNAEMGAGLFFHSPAGGPATFRLEGGTVKGNAASESGGGIFFTGPPNNAGVLELQGVTVAQNSAEIGGGLICINGSFTLRNGAVTDNDAVHDGAGIFYDSLVPATIGGGTLTGNRAAERGGAVLINQGRITHNNGIIAENSARSGGGVYVLSEGEYVKQGGVLYGSEGGWNSGTANMAEGKGDAAYRESGAAHLRNTTVPEAEYFATTAAAGWN
jgi:hypothetical protein